MYASHRQRNVIKYAHINKKYMCNQGQGRVSDSQVYCGHIKSSNGHPVILGQKVQMFPRLIKKYSMKRCPLPHFGQYCDRLIRPGPSKSYLALCSILS